VLVAIGCRDCNLPVNCANCVRMAIVGMSQMSANVPISFEKLSFLGDYVAIRGRDHNLMKKDKRTFFALLWALQRCLNPATTRSGSAAISLGGRRRPRAPPRDRRLRANGAESRDRTHIPGKPATQATCSATSFRRKPAGPARQSKLASPGCSSSLPRQLVVLGTTRFREV